MIPSFSEIGIVVAGISFLLGILVLFSSKDLITRKKYIAYFTISSLSGALWILINTVLLPEEILDLNILVNLSFACSIIMIVSIWRFAVNYRYQDIHKFVFYLDRVISILGTLFFVISLFSNLIITNTIQTSDKLILEFGSLYLPFSIYFLFVFGIAGIVMFYLYSMELGKNKRQLFYFISGFLLTALISVLTNLILPFLTGDSSSSRIGPFGMIFFISFSSYAIIRYQFLDVRVLFGKITYYVLVGGMFFGGYYLIYYIDRWVFGSSDAFWAFIAGIFNALIFAFIFVKFNDYLRTQVRSRIINPGYDPLEVLDRLSRQVAQMLEIDQISNEAMTVLHQTIRADYEAIYVSTSDDNKKEFLVEHEHRAKDLDKEMLSKVFKIWSSSSRSPIVYQELEYEMPIKFLGTPDLVKEIYEYMKSENLRVILPLRDTDENAGMLVLGQKEADSSYSVQDIEFIQGVATTVGLAVTRAFYYEEVQDLNRNLQKRVEEATEELQGKNARLEKALKKIEDIRQQERDMIDVMGHELRTPITIVRNALLVLQSKLKDRKRVETKSVKEYVEKAVESARREINLVETLLSATKVESNRIQLTLTKIDMLDVVNDSIEGHKGFAKDKKIKIDYKKPKKKIYGFADRTRIQEVVDNFLSNAIKYTMRGKVSISIKTDREYAAISITDTGIGISKDDLKHLGKKFFRAKQYLKNDDGETNDVVRPGGTGLGLYVSFNLVRLMDGEVEVESEIGKGSTFTLKVPKYDGQKDKHIDQTFEEPI